MSSSGAINVTANYRIRDPIACRSQRCKDDDRPLRDAALLEGQEEMTEREGQPTTL
jgi:hypothetical protein